ncbi:MAG: hypothetical protein U1F60_06220 [Planctomycetota bacterium]
MGSIAASSVVFLGLAAAGFAQVQAPAPVAPGPKPILPEVVLCGARDGAPVAEYGLGDGGVLRERDELRFTEHGCVTPGGVEVDVKSVGVKLTFPSGRELLVAPDGFVHLRSGEQAGPFAGGLELRLADSAMVRIVLVPGADLRLRDVVVVHGDRALQPWRRGAAASEQPRVVGWPGVHVSCGGDGGDLYRTIALGPLVVLERVLVAADREANTPSERLVVLTAPLLRSLAQMPRQHRETDLPVRQAVAAVTAVAERGEAVFPAGASLRRVEQDELRWQLEGGFELQVDLDGPMAPRLSLFAGQSAVPMVEWTLRGDGAAFLANPREEQLGKRWHGNGTRLGPVVADLQANAELFERPHALRVIERLAAAWQQGEGRRRGR